MGTPLGPKYTPYSNMDPLGKAMGGPGFLLYACTYYTSYGLHIGGGGPKGEYIGF